MAGDTMSTDRDAESVVELALCETRSLVLRAGTLYRFYPIQGCAKCWEISQEYKDEPGVAHPAPITERSTTDNFTAEAVRLKMELDGLNRLTVNEDSVTIERRGLRDGTSRSWRCTVRDEDGQLVAKAAGPSMRHAVRNCATGIIENLKRTR